MGVGWWLWVHCVMFWHQRVTTHPSTYFGMLFIQQKLLIDTLLRVLKRMSSPSSSMMMIILINFNLWKLSECMASSSNYSSCFCRFLKKLTYIQKNAAVDSMHILLEWLASEVSLVFINDYSIIYSKWNKYIDIGYINRQIVIVDRFGTWCE